MRKLMWFSIGFAAACAFGAYWYVDWLLTAAAVIAVLGILLAVATYWVKPLRIGAAFCFGAALGLCWFSVYDSMFLQTAREVDGQTVSVTMVVLDYSYDTDYGAAFDADILFDGQTCKARVYLNEDLELEPGNRVIGNFKFQITTGSSEDVTYHRGNGVFLTASQRSDVIVERFWTVPLRCYPAVWAKKIQNIIQKAFPEDTFGFAQALLLGDRSGIDYKTSTNFKVSGISHIIAVSGLHVSILFSLIYIITGRRRWSTALVGIPVVLIFAAMVGFSPSVTRAAIMQILMILAMLVNKEYDPPTALSFAGLLMMIINPLVISSVSFQLSFSCMMGIMLSNQPIQLWLMDQKRLGRFRGKIINWLSSGIAVSVSASVFTVPLVAVYFETISLVSLLTNLLTVWIVSFIFYGTLLVCILGLIHSGAAAAVAWVVAWPIRYVLWVSDILASFPLAAVYTKSVYIVIWLVFVYILLGIFLLLRCKPVGEMAGLVVLTLCLCIGLSWAEPMTDDFRMTMLDVGQGQAILLQSEGKTYLVDCGGDYDEETADIVSETLLSQGIRRLDGIVLTHYDGDHSGGAAYLLSRIDTDLLLLPHSNDAGGVGAYLAEIVEDGVWRIKKDTVLSFGNAKLTLFAPISYNSGNESSMSVLFQTEKCAILITGDMGEDGERLLMKYHELPQVDVLVVGHHGSKYSTSELLLETVCPSFAFISVGENSYGHPAQVILDRLVQYGCIIYRTDENGTIIYRG